APRAMGPLFARNDGSGGRIPLAAPALRPRALPDDLHARRAGVGAVTARQDGHGGLRAWRETDPAAVAAKAGRAVLPPDLRRAVADLGREPDRERGAGLDPSGQSGLADVVGDVLLLLSKGERRTEGRSVRGGEIAREPRQYVRRGRVQVGGMPARGLAVRLDP